MATVFDAPSQELEKAFESRFFWRAHGRYDEQLRLLGDKMSGDAGFPAIVAFISKMLPFSSDARTAFWTKLRREAETAVPAERS